MNRPSNPISGPTHAGYVLIVTIEEGLKNNKFGEHTQLVTACHNVIVDLINEVYAKGAERDRGVPDRRDQTEIPGEKGGRQ